MPLLPFAPLSASTSALVSTPSGDKYGRPTATPILSSIHDADVSATTIGQWEAEKWRPVGDAISRFASSPIAAEANFSAEKVVPVMDRTVTDALKQLGSLHNELLAHAGQMQPINPSCRKHFVDLASKIHVFIQGMS